MKKIQFPIAIIVFIVSAILFGAYSPVASAQVSDISALQNEIGAAQAIATAATNNTRIDFLSAGQVPSAVVFDNITNSIWVANAGDNTISKFNPVTGVRVEYPVNTIGNIPTPLAFDPVTKSIWVVNSFGTATKIDIFTGTTTATYSLVTTAAAIAFDNVTNSLWVANYSNSISKVNIFDGTHTEYPRCVNFPSAMAFDNVTNSVWMSSGGCADLTKIDIFNGSMTDYPMGPGPAAMAFDNVTNSIWVTTYDNKISKVNIFDGTKVSYPAQLVLFGATFDPITNSVWTVNSNAYKVSKFNIFNGSSVQYPVQVSPDGIAFDPYTSSIWVTNYGGIVSKLNVNTGGAANSYTPASISTLQSAITAAQAITSADPQATINAALAALQSAVAGLQAIPPADFSALNAEIAVANAVATAAQNNTRIDYPVGAVPGGVVFDNITNSLWVLNTASTTLSKVNITTGARVDYPTIAVGTIPSAIAFDSVTQSIWIANFDDTVSKVNIFNGTRVEYSVGSLPASMVFDPVTNSLWVGNYNNTVSKMNVFDGTHVEYPACGNYPAGMAFDNVTNSVWIANGSCASASKINIFDGTRVDYPAGNSPSAIAFDSATNSVWVGNHNNTVNKINIFDGTKVDYAAGNIIFGMIFDNVTDSIWTLNYDDTVSKFNIFTGVHTEYPVGTTPTGIAFDNVTNSVWVTSYNSIVSKLNVNTGGASSAYTPASIAALQSAITAAQAINVLDSQATVDAEVVTLTNAVAGLVPVAPTNLSALTAQIAVANAALLNATPEGTALGSHIVGSFAILQNAINVAALVTSPAQVPAALAALNAAVAFFNQSVITGIDTTAPIITIEPYATTTTNQDVVVNASTTEGILNAVSHTFTDNGSFDFVATDSAGNIATSTVTISHIDKVAPTATVAYSTVAPTN
ncbi:MAG: hypothetical protein Q7S34_01115, partial [bacterium]|nr:hypothetical protein [bacterium]